MAFGHKLSRQRLKQLVILTVALLTAVSTATAQNRLESHRSGVDNAAVPQDLLLAGVNRSECSAPRESAKSQLNNNLNDDDITQQYARAAGAAAAATS